MAWDDELRGALSVGWTTRRRVHDEDLRTLEAIAGLATVACRNAEAYEHVQHVARTDALTGVLNHGAMQLRIREEIARARRDGHPLGAVILDLDDFKARQRHPRPRGRRRAAAQRRPRAAGRAAPLRPGRPLRRRRVRAPAPRLRRGDDRRTSPSAAATRSAASARSASPRGTTALDADGLLEQADRALMLAKRTGKGRVAVANPEVERELALLQSPRPARPPPCRRSPPRSRSATTTRTSTPTQVVHLARGVAMMLGLAAEHVERIAHAALLHDVGKLAMPARDPRTRTARSPREEWEVMAEHPIVGERILLRTKELAAIAPIVRHEHEHWDGTGYPDGLERHAHPGRLARHPRLPRLRSR